jgi:hypothetical protein
MPLRDSVLSCAPLDAGAAIALFAAFARLLTGSVALAGICCSAVDRATAQARTAVKAFGDGRRSDSEIRHRRATSTECLRRINFFHDGAA